MEGAESKTESDGVVLKGVPAYGGNYIHYNVLGNLFEVSSNYVPLIRPVGRGAYGIVCCAKNADTKEDVAIKKIGNAFDNNIDAKRTLREIQLLCHMDHENDFSFCGLFDLIALGGGYEDCGDAVTEATVVAKVW